MTSWSSYLTPVVTEEPLSQYLLNTNKLLLSLELARCTWVKENGTTTIPTRISANAREAKTLQLFITQGADSQPFDQKLSFRTFVLRNVFEFKICNLNSCQMCRKIVQKTCSSTKAWSGHGFDWIILRCRSHSKLNVSWIFSKLIYEHDLK